MSFHSWRVLAAAGAIALIGAAAAKCTSGPAQRAPEFRPVATLAEVMEANVAPSSTLIFDAVVYNNGVLENPPKTDEQWETIEHGAIALAESANLLLLPGRAMDDGDWVKMSHALSDAALRAKKAALARNVDQLLDAGGVVYETCTACHAKYLLQAQAQREQAQKQQPAAH